MKEGSDTKERVRPWLVWVRLRILLWHGVGRIVMESPRLEVAAVQRKKMDGIMKLRSETNQLQQSRRNNGSCSLALQPFSSFIPRTPHVNLLLIAHNERHRVRITILLAYPTNNNKSIYLLAETSALWPFFSFLSAARKFALLGFYSSQKDQLSAEANPG